MADLQLGFTSKRSTKLISRQPSRHRQKAVQCKCSGGTFSAQNFLENTISFVIKFFDKHNLLLNTHSCHHNFLLNITFSRIPFLVGHNFLLNTISCRPGFLVEYNFLLIQFLVGQDFLSNTIFCSSKFFVEHNFLLNTIYCWLRFLVECNFLLFRNFGAEFLTRLFIPRNSDLRFHREARENQ